MRIPARLGLIAGDASHNLRSALDHLVWQLATVGAGPGRFTQFPLFDDADEYRRNEERFLQGVVEGHRARIEALQPYHVRKLIGAGDGLSGLRDPLATNLYLMAVGRLDNADKHRLLLAITSVARFRQPKFKGVKAARGTYPAEWIRMEDGAEVFRVTEVELLPGATEVKMEEPSYTILFGDPEYDVVALWSDRTKAAVSLADLLNATDHVQHVIDSFAPDLG